MTQDVFAALADPTRRALLEELSDGERAVGELVAAVDASQPTVSKHLRVLRESGLVHQRAVGQKRFYRIEAPVLLTTAEALRELAGAPAQPAEDVEPSQPVEAAEQDASAVGPSAEPSRAVRPEPVLAAAASAAESRPGAEPPATGGRHIAATAEPEPVSETEHVSEPAPAAAPQPTEQAPPGPVQAAQAHEDATAAESSAADAPDVAAKAAQPLEDEPGEQTEQLGRFPARLDPLSAPQDGSAARPRGVGGLVSSMLRRRRR